MSQIQIILYSPPPSWHIQEQPHDLFMSHFTIPIAEVKVWTQPLPIHLCYGENSKEGWHNFRMVSLKKQRLVIELRQSLFEVSLIFRIQMDFSSQINLQTLSHSLFQSLTFPLFLVNLFYHAICLNKNLIWFMWIGKRITLYISLEVKEDNKLK